MNHVLSPEELKAGQTADQAIKARGVDGCPAIASLPKDQVELEDWYVKFWPRGSGELGMMRIICQMLEEIALARGYTTNFAVLRADNNLKYQKHWRM